MKKILLLLLSVNLAAAEMVLVRDGVPQAEIVLEEKPSASAQMGAFELNHHVKMITGAEFPVKYGKGTEGKLHIELGGDNKPAGKEYSSIRFSANGIRIYGSDDADFHKVNYKNLASFPSRYNGTLFAVYDFLEKYCGVRWYGLTDDATAFSPRKTLAVEIRDHDHSSPMDAFRGFSHDGRASTVKVLKFTGRDEALMKLRWRSTDFFGKSNHNVYRIYFTYWGKAKKKEYAALFKEHRENYFAQGYKGRMPSLDGYLRREYPDDVDCPPGICFSEPGVVEFFANQAVEQWNGLPMVGLPSNGKYLKRAPGKPFFSSVQHMDTQGPCYCPKCVARMKAGQDHNHIMWQWIADIAEAAEKKQPGIGIATLAYQRSLAYPENVKLPDNLCVQMCLGVHAWWNPEFYKIQHDEIYKKWVNNRGGKVLSVWLYLFGPSWDAKTRFKHKFFPGIYPHATGKIVKEMVNDGIRGYYIECELYCNMLECYVATKLFYDPSLDTDKIIDEYFTLYYGKAAPEMKEFFTELENAFWNWKNYPASMFGKDGIAKRLRAHSLGTGMLDANNNWSVGTEERMKRLCALIDAAEKKADSPVIRKRISWLRKGFWDQAVEGRQDYVRRLKVNRMPEKNIVINRVENKQGDPSGIDWSRQTSAGDCHTLADGTPVPGAFDLKIAADEEYLYFDFLEKKEQKEPTLWQNFFELFLSGSDRNCITQIAFAPTTKIPLLYRTEMINDVLHTKPTTFKVSFKQLETEKNWHWQMSFPISVLGSKDLRTFQMNFRRFEPESKLVWNKFFASAADCASRMGYVAIKGGNVSPAEVKLGFTEGRILKEIGNWFLNKGTISFTSDPNTAEVKMKAGDILVCSRQIPVVSGDKVTVRWKAEGTVLPRCSLQFYSGSKQLGLKGAKPVSTGKNEFEMSLLTPDKATAFRLYFSTPKSAEFKLDAPSIIIGETKK